MQAVYGKGDVQVPVDAGMVEADASVALEDGGDAGEIWEALDDFTFGTPDLVALPDDEVLMTYYATVDRARVHDNGIRFCPFHPF